MPLRASSPRSFRFAMPSTGVFATIALCAGLAAWPTPAQARPLGLETDDVPIIAAVKSEDLDAVAALLGEATDVDATQPDGATALHWAAQNGHLEMVRHLVEKVKVERVADQLSRTPAVLAKSRGHAAVSDYLSAN